MMMFRAGTQRPTKNSSKRRKVKRIRWSCSSWLSEYYRVIGSPWHNLLDLTQIEPPLFFNSINLCKVVSSYLFKNPTSKMKNILFNDFITPYKRKTTRAFLYITTDQQPQFIFFLWKLCEFKIRICQNFLIGPFQPFQLPVKTFAKSPSEITLKP